MHPIPRHSADPGAAVWANQPDVRPPAIGDALQRARLHPAEPECPFLDHDAQREGAARQALAIGAVARIDQLRLFGDLIADRAALAAAGLRELHRPFLSGLVEGWCPGAELNHRHTDFQSVALPTELPGHGGGLIKMGARPVQRIPRSRARANRCHWIALPAERNLNLMEERLELLIAERDIHARIAALA